MFLFIEDASDGSFANFGITGSASDSDADLLRWSYPISSEGAAVYDGWADTPAEDDAVDSGVFADWLEDHKEYLLAGATGPSDPAKRLDQLVEYLRRRFRNR